MPTLRVCVNRDCHRFDQATNGAYCTGCGQPTETRTDSLPETREATAPSAAAATTALAPPVALAPSAPSEAPASLLQSPRQRGWYQRPEDPAGVQRWYDGTSWTDQLTGGTPDTRAHAPQVGAAQPPAAGWQWPISATASSGNSRPTPDTAFPMPRSLAGTPPELLLVCALMSIAGVLLLWPALQVLPDAFREFGAGPLGRALGLLALDLALVILALGVGLLILAWRLTQADRVARGLSYIVLGGYSFAVLVGDDHSAGLIVTMLLCLAAIGILAAAPNVREYFNRTTNTGPTSVTIVRTLFAAFAFLMLLFGISYLPAGALGGQYVIVGLLLLGIGAAMFTLNRRLADGSASARVAATVLMAGYALLVLIAGGRATATLLGLAFAAAVIGMLWIPEDAQRHFTR